MDTALIKALNFTVEGGSFVGSFIMPTLGGGVCGYFVGRPFKEGCIQGLATAVFRYSGVTQKAHGWITTYSVLAPGRAVCLNPGAVMLCRSLVYLVDFSVPVAVSYGCNYGCTKFLKTRSNETNEQQDSRAVAEKEAKASVQMLALQFLLGAPPVLAPLQMVVFGLVIVNHFKLLGSGGSTFWA
jgi:hypothetical protein